MNLITYINKVGLPILALLVVFLIDPYSLALKAGYGIVLLLLTIKLNSFTSLLDKDFIILLFFGIIYSMFNYFGENKGIQYLIIQIVFPAFFYILGKLLATKIDTSRQVFYLLFSLGLLYSITALISISNNLLTGGFAQYDRTIPIFWDGTELKSTGMAIFLVFNASIPALIVIYRKSLKKLFKVLLILVYIITLLSGFRLGSRTLIVIALLSMLIALILIFSNQSFIDNLKLITSLVIVSSIAIYFLPIDLDSPIFSTLGQRFKTGGAVESTATAGNRTGLWEEGFKNLFEHPLGWKSRHFHHNLWLDTAKVAGIIPLFFLLLNNYSCFKLLKKSFLSPFIEKETSITFIVYFSSIFLLFFTEPVIEGSFFFFTVYCLIFGILKQFISLKIKHI